MPPLDFTFLFKSLVAIFLSTLSLFPFAFSVSYAKKKKKIHYVDSSAPCFLPLNIHWRPHCSNTVRFLLHLWYLLNQESYFSFFPVFVIKNYIIKLKLYMYICLFLRQTPQNCYFFGQKELFTNSSQQLYHSAVPSAKYENVYFPKINNYKGNICIPEILSTS